MIRKYFKFFFTVYILIIPSISFSADATLFITSNIEGQFNLRSDMESDDNSVILLQSLYHLRSVNKNLLYIDMGNAFYPGTLSRYSYGSIVYDYFRMNKCDLSLVSSKDLRLGTGILKQLEKGFENKILLSANITLNKEKAFTPYIIKKIKNKIIVFVGLTSEGSTFDITDKNIADTDITPHMDTLAKILPEIENTVKPDYIILLSGLTPDKNISILSKFKSINLLISGGDSTGTLYGNSIDQIVLPDSRKILFTDRRKGYFRLDLNLGKRLEVGNFNFQKPEKWAAKDRDYKKFINRLNIWKTRYNEEMVLPFKLQKDLKADINNKKILSLMRHKFRTELAIFPGRENKNFTLNADSSSGYIRDKVNDDYYIYTYRLKGETVSRISESGNFIISGLSEGKIQGREIEENRYYTVASTQKIYEIISESEGKTVYKNRWVTISDLIINDIRNEKVSLKKDFSYLDDRFALIFTLSLSNRLSSETVRYGENIDTPSGYSTESIKVLGIEDSADIILFNRFNKITLSPYINYAEETLEDSKYYTSNEMSLKILYQYKPYMLIQPYFKSQLNTLVKEEEYKRPVDIRETAGVLFNLQYVTLKTGLGFDRRIHDDRDIPYYGLEGTVQLEFPFLNSFTYILDIDSFFTKKEMNNKYIKLEFSTGLKYSFSTYFSLSSKYKKIYYKDMELDEKYESKSYTFSLDFNIDFKVF